jgi:S-formylglutathione hydrolase FrmB
MSRAAGDRHGQRDLVAHIEASHRVLPTRLGELCPASRWRGYGALTVAFDQPGLFAGVTTARCCSRRSSAEQGARRAAGGPPGVGDPVDTALWNENDPLLQARKVEAKAAPALFLDCGAEDRYGLANGHRELHRILEERGVSHSFELPPGDHGYEYVRTRLEKSLRFLGERLSQH